MSISPRRARGKARQLVRRRRVAAGSLLTTAQRYGFGDDPCRGADVMTVDATKPPVSEALTRPSPSPSPSPSDDAPGAPPLAATSAPMNRGAVADASGDAPGAADAGATDAAAVTTVDRAVGGPWLPLVTGAQAAEAWQAVEAITDELAEVVRRAPPELTQGVLGADLAVFFYYLHAATGDARHRALAGEAIDHAAGALAESALRKALFDGFLRIGWSVEHLRRRGWVDAPDDTCGAIDDALLGPLERGDLDHFDLMSGLAGQAVYALERAPLGISTQLLGRIAARLTVTAIARPGGHAWHTDPQWLAPWQREAHPAGYFDLGLSHGSACVVRVLSELTARGLAPADGPLAGAVRWLLGCEVHDAVPSGFRYFTEGTTASDPARLAWCYGDPGVAIALADSARLCDRPDWAAEARRIAARAAAIPLDRAGVQDAAICHGAAGLAHTFRRLALATGEASCDDAARRWLGATLAMRRPDPDGAGFFAFEVRQRQWVRDPTLLTGSAGIGLALLAAVSAIEPAWDRLLLLSTTPTFAAQVAP
jgi:hypothetical protein